jgi:hypothetical protein
MRKQQNLHHEWEKIELSSEFILDDYPPNAR